MKNTNTHSEQPQNDLLRSNADFFRTSLEAGRQLIEMQTRSFTSLASRQAEVANQYLNETMAQFLDPMSLGNPYSYFSKQADILQVCGRQAMDGMVEVVQEAAEHMAESRDEMNRVMEEMSRAAIKSMEAAQSNVSEISKASARSVEKASDRAAKS